MKFIKRLKKPFGYIFAILIGTMPGIMKPQYVPANVPGHESDYSVQETLNQWKIKLEAEFAQIKQLYSFISDIRSDALDNEKKNKFIELINLSTKEIEPIRQRIISLKEGLSGAELKQWKKIFDYLKDYTNWVNKTKKELERIKIIKLDEFTTQSAKKFIEYIGDFQKDFILGRKIWDIIQKVGALPFLQKDTRNELQKYMEQIIELIPQGVSITQALAFELEGKTNPAVEAMNFALLQIMSRFVLLSQLHVLSANELLRDNGLLPKVRRIWEYSRWKSKYDSLIKYIGAKKLNYAEKEITRLKENIPADLAILAGVAKMMNDEVAHEPSYTCNAPLMKKALSTARIPVLPLQEKSDMIKTGLASGFAVASMISLIVALGPITPVVVLAIALLIGLANIEGIIDSFKEQYYRFNEDYALTRNMKSLKLFFEQQIQARASVFIIQLSYLKLYETLFEYISEHLGNEPEEYKQVVMENLHKLKGNRKQLTNTLVQRCIIPIYWLYKSGLVY